MVYDCEILSEVTSVYDFFSPPKKVKQLLTPFVLHLCITTVCCAKCGAFHDPGLGMTALMTCHLCQSKERPPRVADYENIIRCFHPDVITEFHHQLAHYLFRTIHKCAIAELLPITYVIQQVFRLLEIPDIDDYFPKRPTDVECGWKELWDYVCNELKWRKN